MLIDISYNSISYNTSQHTTHNKATQEEKQTTKHNYNNVLHNKNSNVNSSEIVDVLKQILDKLNSLNVITAYNQNDRNNQNDNLKQSNTYTQSSYEKQSNEELINNLNTGDEFLNNLLSNANHN